MPGGCPVCRALFQSLRVRVRCRINEIETGPPRSPPVRRAGSPPLLRAIPAAAGTTRFNRGRTVAAPPRGPVGCSVVPHDHLHVPGRQRGQPVAPLQGLSFGPLPCVPSTCGHGWLSAALLPRSSHGRVHRDTVGEMGIVTAIPPWVWPALMPKPSASDGSLGSFPDREIDHRARVSPRFRDILLRRVRTGPAAGSQPALPPKFLFLHVPRIHQYARCLARGGRHRHGCDAVRAVGGDCCLDH